MPMMDMTPKVSCRYGAPMGRRNSHPGNEPEEGSRFYLQRVRLDMGGYDRGGAYWGTGTPLYSYQSECGEVSGFLRANSRSEAKDKIREDYPNAQFFI